MAVIHMGLCLIHRVVRRSFSFAHSNRQEGICGFQKSFQNSSILRSDVRVPKTNNNDTTSAELPRLAV